MNKSKVLKTGMEYKIVIFLSGIKIPISMKGIKFSATEGRYVECEREDRYRTACGRMV